MFIGEAGQAAKDLWGDVFENSAPVYGGGKGGQFKMDPEELSGVIGQWEDLLDQIVHDGQLIERMRGNPALAPGRDSVSDNYAGKTVESLGALQKQNESMRKYAQDYIKKLKDARSKMLVTDAGLATTFKPSAT
ncbi:hypothetical protein M8542_04920 [Amycolatopsis sp. OK19-0408]|uniref:PE domain-containing protein n=1 Tax=Amycolatopsis iheyensis TaxID=2945988 RepID=A0A9X2N7A7_9PSEU|nr:hypothetical protein [Amycolatopsis iheyensis]MCR6482143.1 hypothetical protein [Amycolatopsis iheyensis]